MATYYVRPDGNNANTGTGQAANQAWQTVQKALGATGIGSGDTLYIAPGTYREAITIAGTYSAITTIIGDRTASQFSGITAGYVRITGLASDALGVATSVGNFTTNGKSYLTFDSIWLEHRITLAASSSNITFIRCQMTTPFQPVPSSVSSVIQIVTTGQSAILFDKCFIQGAMNITGTGTSTTTRFNSCLIQCATYSSGAIEFDNSGACAMTFSNCTIFGSSLGQVFRAYGPTLTCAVIYNSLIVNDVSGSPTFGTNVTATFTEDYNAGYITRTGTPAGANSKQLYHRAFTNTPIYINPIDASIIPYTPLAGDSLIGAGSATYSFGTDYFGNAWANPPSIGAMELKTYSTIGSYFPTERNASTITIAPGSTSQSIELYLGVTGLTASISGLSARYNRTRTASVSIPLVARTIAQAWTSGGFAEVDATNMPGVYRLDLPDAALAAGADDVTVMVRGASGTNGAVMTVKLSSGGLTSAQTAAAVLDAVGSSYVTAGSIGYAIQNSNVASISGSTAAADELEGALLHNGTDYISADLLTPVSAATSVHIGPYQLLADGLGADQPLDVNVGTATSIDVQVTDANGTGIDITGATVTAKVYNAGGTLVATYSGTATYADNGRLSFGLTTTVTNTSGTYTVTVTRTTGATDTQVFGPLKLYVRPV
jgi:hypothetical protein